MSPRRKTEPSTRVSSRSARTGRSGLIAREKTEKQSAKERTALDNRFHRTDLTLSCAASFACRSRSGAAVAGEKLRATTFELVGCRPKPGRTSFSVKLGRH